jgi:hypothetical protein
MKKMVETNELTQLNQVNNEPENKLNPKHYLMVKYGIANLIGFGTFSKNRLQKKDVYRKTIEEYKKIYTLYQVICCLIIHFSLIANISTIVYYLYAFWKYGEIRKLAQSIILFLIYLTSVFAYDLSFYNRKITNDLLNDICEEDFIINSIKADNDVNKSSSSQQKIDGNDNSNKSENKCYLKIFFKFRDNTLKAVETNKLMLIFTFVPPIICIVISVAILIIKIAQFDWINIQYSFFIFNTALILYKIIFHIIITILLIIKFIGLNKFVQKLIVEKNTKEEELQKIIKW